MDLVLPQPPRFRLDGKRALVTGAGRGIGLAGAAALAQAGAAVTLVARSGGEVEEAAAALRDQGLQADAVATDVLDSAGFRALIDGLEPFDVFLNNAGTNRPKPFLDVTEADYDVVLDLNLRAAFFAAQAVARRLVEAGRPGSIINMSSQMGHVGAARRSIYCASKHGLEGLTKAMAIELGPYQVRVNTICPTFIETPMTAPFFADATFRDAVVAKIKLGRIGSVSDLTGAIVFLASDASALMTGAPLLVDGGWTAE